MAGSGSGARPALIATLNEVLFAHWAFEPQALRPLLPDGFEPERIDGRAWVGVVAGRVEHARPGWLPLESLGPSFPQLAVRTYVRHRGRRGTLLLSLDAGSLMAARAARRALRVDAHHASMDVDRSGGLRLRSRRTQRGSHAAAFDAIYAPDGPAEPAAAGSDDEFLTGPETLFRPSRRSGIRALRLVHAPLPLQPAWADIRVNALLEALGLRARLEPPLLHYVGAVDLQVREEES